MNKIVQIVILLFLINNITYSNSWEFIKGPNTMRSISAIEIDKETIFIGLYEKLFKSTDFGKNWIEIKYNDTLSFSNIKNLIKLDSIIFLQSAYRTRGNNYELMKSTDNGKTWLEENFGYQLSNVRFITKFDNNVYAHIFIMIDNQVRRKTLKYDKNKGKWIEIIDDTIYSKIQNTIKTIIEYKSKIYLGTEILQASIDQGYKRPNIFIYDTLSKQMISIVDTSSDLWKSYVNCILVKDNELFIGTSTGVYKSTDEGITWIRKSNGLRFKNEYYDYDYEIHKMTEYDGVIYAITNPPRPYGNYYPSYTTLVYSSDNGESWINDTLFTIDVPQEVKVIDNKLIISSYYGLFETDKFLTKKTQLIKDTLNSGYVYDFIVDNDTIYASNDIFIGYKSLESDNWLKLYPKVAYQTAKLIAKNGDDIYTVTTSNILVFSNDAGETFNYAKELISISNLYINAIEIDEEGIVYIGTNAGLFLSTNQGKNWIKQTPENFTNMIISVLITKDYWFIGTSKGIFRSLNKGITWENLNLGSKYPEVSVYDMKLFNQKLYATTQYVSTMSKSFPINGEGIFVSTDFGNTWEKRKNGYPDSLASVSLASYRDYVFAATHWHGSVYYSSNEGANWYPLNNGLAGYSLSKIKVFGDYLYAATSVGLHRYNLKNLVVGVDDSQINVNPDYLWASVAYPNPAKDFVQAKVWWDTHNDIEKAEVVVYDVYGNRVSGRENVTIIPENDYSGLIRWDCSSFPSGVYILTIQHGTCKQAVRMIKE